MDRGQVLMLNSSFSGEKVENIDSTLKQLLGINFCNVYCPFMPFN